MHKTVLMLKKKPMTKRSRTILFLFTAKELILKFALKNSYVLGNKISNTVT